MPKLAVVFDGSGVLYGPVRILKDIEKGEVKHIQVSGINIAGEIEKGAMMILITNPAETMEKVESSKLVSSLLKEMNIPIKVIYKRDKTITDKEVKETIMADKNVTLKDVQDTISYIRKYDILPVIGTSLIVEVGSGIKYILTGGGNLFLGISQVVDTLKKLNIGVFIASGDKIEKTGLAADLFGLPPENIWGMMAPEDKKELVKKLKEKYKRVMMVGDDRNDYLAMKEADIAVLSLQAEAERAKEIFDVADYTIKDIREVIRIIEEDVGKNER